MKLLHRGYPELGPLAEAYGLTEVGDHARVVEQGVPFELSLLVNSGTVVGLDIVATGRAFPAITLSVENAYDRMTKHLRLDVEPQVGDPVFDALVYVDTTLDEALVRQLFAPLPVRQAVAWLLATDARRIRLGERGVAIRARCDALDPAVFRRYAAPLVTLARALPALPPGAGARRGYRGAALVLLFAIGWSASGLATFASALPGYQALESTPYWLGLVLQPALFALFAPLAWLRVRGLPRSSIAFFVSLAVFAFGCIYHSMDLLWLNAALDASPGVERTFRVLERSNHEDSTLLTLESWQRHRRPVTLRFRGTPPIEGDRVRVTTHAGALGWEWCSAER